MRRVGFAGNGTGRSDVSQRYAKGTPRSMARRDSASAPSALTLSTSVRTKPLPLLVCIRLCEGEPLDTQGQSYLVRGKHDQHAALGGEQACASTHTFAKSSGSGGAEPERRQEEGTEGQLTRDRLGGTCSRHRSYVTVLTGAHGSPAGSSACRRAGTRRDETRQAGSAH